MGGQPLATPDRARPTWSFAARNVATSCAKAAAAASAAVASVVNVITRRRSSAFSFSMPSRVCDVD